MRMFVFEESLLWRSNDALFTNFQSNNHAELNRWVQWCVCKQLWVSWLKYQLVCQFDGEWSEWHQVKASYNNLSRQVKGRLILSTGLLYRFRKDFFPLCTLYFIVKISFQKADFPRHPVYYFFNGVECGKGKFNVFKYTLYHSLPPLFPLPVNCLHFCSCMIFYLARC